VNARNTTSNALFTADVHLKPHDERSKELFAAFLDHFSSRVEVLYILGDLFNYWLGNVDDYHPAYDTVFEACEKFTKRSRLCVVHGNRDFFMGDRFPRNIPAEVFWDPVKLRAGERNVYACHGHMLAEGDKGFNFVRLAFHNRFVVWLNNRFPRSLREYYSGGLRNISRRKSRRNPRPEIRLSNEKLLKIFSGGIDIIVGGHFHRALERKFALQTESGPVEKELYLLEDWGRTAPYILIGADGKVVRGRFTTGGR